MFSWKLVLGAEGQVLQTVTAFVMTDLKKRQWVNIFHAIGHRERILLLAWWVLSM